MNADLTKLRFPSKISVTDQDISIDLSQEQKEHYIDLFKRLLDIYTSAHTPRVIIGLVGPTGSGKSVVAALFKCLADQIELDFQFETLGIDALHYPNDYLLATHDTSGRSLKDFKGRFDTYDVPKLITTLRDFFEGKTVSLPQYSRKSHEPVDHASEVSAERSVLLVEGLWLLFDKEGWGKVGKYLDYSFFLEADKQTARDFVIQRHVKGGRTLAESSDYYDNVDGVNFDLVIQTKRFADEVLPSYFYQ